MDESIPAEPTRPPSAAAPKLLFLGLAERAAYVREGNTDLFKWNVLGLKHTVLAHFFPLPLSGFYACLAFTPEHAAGSHKLRFVGQRDAEIGQMEIHLSGGSAQALHAGASRLEPTLRAPAHGWTTMFLQLRDPPIIVWEPGEYEVRYCSPEGEYVVGVLVFVWVEPTELSEERIAAIRADPTAAKAARIEVGCKHCAAKLRAYAALDRSEKAETEGWIWYKYLSDRFRCACGQTDVPLAYLRQGLVSVIGFASQGKLGSASLVPLYERSAIETLRVNFAQLLNADPQEERIQQFMEANPILLHQFASVRLFLKPPILTFFVADFALLTPKKELVLIEIERASTRLLKKGGGVAAPLSHAFDQVRDWLHVVDEHRLAVLDALNIDKADVSSIRGVVIAGRDHGCDALELRKLKGTDWGRTSLFTYDDLLFGLASLVDGMDRL